ncbi:hypothetical protein FRC16_003087, partial [Serendipita sp. 398]
MSLPRTLPTPVTDKPETSFRVTPKLIVRNLSISSEISALQSLEAVITKLSSDDPKLAIVMAQGASLNKTKVEGQPDYAFIKLKEKVDETGNPERLIPWLDALARNELDAGWAGHYEFDVARRVTYDLGEIVKLCPSPRTNGTLKPEISHAISSLSQLGHPVILYTPQLSGTAKILYVTFKSRQSVVENPAIKIDYKGTTYTIPMKPTNLYEPFHPYEIVLTLSPYAEPLSLLPEIALLVRHRYPRREEDVLQIHGIVDPNDYPTEEIPAILEQSAVQHIRVIDHDNNKALIVLFRTYEYTAMASSDIFSEGFSNMFFAMNNSNARLNPRGNLIEKYNANPYVESQHGDRTNRELKTLTDAANTMSADVSSQFAELKKDLAENRALTKHLIMKDQKSDTLLGIVCGLVKSSNTNIEAQEAKDEIRIEMDEIADEIINLQDQKASLRADLIQCNDPEKSEFIKQELHEISSQLSMLKEEQTERRKALKAVTRDYGTRAREDSRLINQFLIPAIGSSSSIASLTDTHAHVGNNPDASYAHLSEMSSRQSIGSINVDNNQINATTEQTPTMELDSDNCHRTPHHMDSIEEIQAVEVASSPLSNVSITPSRSHSIINDMNGNAQASPEEPNNGPSTSRKRPSSPLSPSTYKRPNTLNQGSNPNSNRSSTRVVANKQKNIGGKGKGVAVRLERNDMPMRFSNMKPLEWRKGLEPLFDTPETTTCPDPRRNILVLLPRCSRVKNKNSLSSKRSIPRKNWWITISFLTFFFLLSLLPTTLAAHHPPVSGISFYALNADGLSNPHKVAEINRSIKLLKPTAYIISETQTKSARQHLDPDDYERFENPGVSKDKESGTKWGVIVGIRRDTQVKSVVGYDDSLSGRVIAVDIVIDGGGFGIDHRLIGVYAPHDGHKSERDVRFWDHIREMAKGAPNGWSIIGDFNITMASQERSSLNLEPSVHRERYTKLLVELKGRDAWEDHTDRSTDLEWTLKSKSGDARSIIDRAAISTIGIVSFTIKVVAAPFVPYTDHRPILFSIVPCTLGGRIIGSTVKVQQDLYRPTPRIRIPRKGEHKKYETFGERVFDSIPVQILTKELIKNDEEWSEIYDSLTKVIVEAADETFGRPTSKIPLKLREINPPEIQDLRRESRLVGSVIRFLNTKGKPPGLRGAADRYLDELVKQVHNSKHTIGITTTESMNTHLLGHLKARRKKLNGDIMKARVAYARQKQRVIDNKKVRRAIKGESIQRILCTPPDRISAPIALAREDGQIITEPEEIKTETRQFYQGLYSKSYNQPPVKPWMDSPSIQEIRQKVECNP